MAGIRLPPPPTNTEEKSAWQYWFLSIKDSINAIAASAHNTLSSIQGGSTTERYHLTLSNVNKLGGIATGATANSTDAFLLARANHTGTQLLNTISNAGTAASQSGLTVVINTAKLTAGGVNGSMTFTNGVLTAQTQAT